MRIAGWGWGCGGGLGGVGGGGYVCMDVCMVREEVW